SRTGRTTPLNSARAVSSYTTQATTTPPLPATTARQSYATNTSAAPYTSTGTQQHYQYPSNRSSATAIQQQVQQQVVQQVQQRQQAQQAKAADNSVSSLLAFGDYPYRVPPAPPAVGTYPTTNAATKNMYATSNVGYNVRQSPSQTYRASMATAQQSSYPAASNPSVRNITNQKTFGMQTNGLAQPSTSSQQPYATHSPAHAAVSASMPNVQSMASTTTCGYGAPVTQAAQPVNRNTTSPALAQVNRLPWTSEEMEALKDRVIMHGPNYALIKQEDDRSMSPKLTLRSQYAIQDKAQQMAMMYYR
ncbi:hypothetical protein KEM55_007738, partial [Ascosphaera atra]